MYGPIPINVANFGLIDKWTFGPTRSLKFLNKLQKYFGSAQKLHSGMVWFY